MLRQVHLPQVMRSCLLRHQVMALLLHMANPLNPILLLATVTSNRIIPILLATAVIKRNRKLVTKLLRNSNNMAQAMAPARLLMQTLTHL